MNVLIIGDACEDKYVFGTCKRLSPEQPIPVLDQTHIESRPGMAGNVELNLQAFGVDTLLLKQRETIIKTRFVDSNSKYQLLRVDETPKVTPIQSSELRMALMSMNPDAIVISDYDKGYVNEQNLQILCDNFNRPIFVDTKKRRLFQKDNVYWKINEKEYDLLDKDYLPDESHLIVTLGSRGVRWAGMIYQAQKVECFDVCGAGDTFMAAFVHKFLQTNGDMVKSIDLANRAAAISVQYPGAYHLNQEDIESLYGGGKGANKIGTDALQATSLDA